MTFSIHLNNNYAYTEMVVKLNLNSLLMESAHLLFDLIGRLVFVKTRYYDSVIKLLHKTQSSFRAGHSCETVLIHNAVNRY